MRHTVRHLADARSAEGGGKHIVDGRRLVLAQKLPHQTATYGIRHRLPEGHAVATRRVEIEVAVVGMGEEVCGEGVVVPHKARLEVVAYAVERYARIGGVGDPAVVAEHQGVYARRLNSCEPRTATRGKSEARVGRQRVRVALREGVVKDRTAQGERLLRGAGPCKGETCLQDEFLLIEAARAIMARVSVAHRGERAHRLAETPLGVEMRL